MSFKNLDIQPIYIGKGRTISDDFVLPVLSAASSYDRITSYFTADSLISVSQGLEHLFKNSGKMRLIIGRHSVPNVLVDASTKTSSFKDEINKVKKDIQNNLISLNDALIYKQLATLAWMIEDHLLEVKVIDNLSDGIFHPKTFIFTDENGDKIIASGSPNETGMGLGGNTEQLMVMKSWESLTAATILEDFFASLWNGTWEGTYTYDITEETVDLIYSSIGNEYKRKRDEDSFDIIKNAAIMPACFFMSGDIPGLYVHQERAVIDALSRWPVRVLFADEVGLGKTFEVASTIVFMTKYYGLKKVVILTPKSVLQQWQDELVEHFNLDAWIYDSAQKAYISPDHKLIKVKSPLCHDTPHISLISAQFARGSKQQGSIFDNCDKYLPELLVLDEAHSARVSSDISGKKKKTLMYEMLEKVSSKIPHLILATATPMQKEASEYHSLLKLLGLPNLWLKDRNYDTSLRLLSSNGPPDLSDAYNAYLLIKSTINQMSPDLRSLTTEEKKLLEQLISDDLNIDRSHRGQLVCHNWETFRNIFIKLHPAHLLTVRNTRRSLESIGYSFPKRNLINVSIDDSLDIEMFYKKVNDYLSNNCFQIEQALYPDRAISIGFVRTSYQQRVASSLFSCKYSLKRRLEKVQQIKRCISSGNLSNISNNVDFSDADSFDADDLMFRDVDIIDNNNSVSIDYRQLLRSANLEETELTSLIKGASDILKQKGDPKIKYAIQLVEDYISDGKTVLVFSRYADTISALLDAFSAHPLTNNLEYGIYTGQQCSIVKHGIASTSDKTELKNHLFSHKMSIVFCSDAASEGLNLQAAQVLINVDVPWTPSRLEQRIGRIARLGQKAKEVDICNIWYPNSIEARMYKRIQTRLEVTNMTVGEFPQVVADEIVAAVLEDKEDSLSINSSLNKIRTSTQIDALELIWNRNTGSSYSDQTRKLMITIAEKELNHKNQDDIIEFMLPSGKHECLSPETGVPETVSLHSKIWDYIKLTESNIDIIKDKNGFSCAFSVKNEPSKRIYLCGVLKRCLNISTDESDYYIDMPSSLPNIMSLHTITDSNMDYSDKPELWI